MAHNTLVRADLAAWSVATPVTPAEFWKIDQNQYKAIDGDDGGTWVPAAAIEIAGSGMMLSGANHTLPGTLTVTGALYSSGGAGAISGSWSGSPGFSGTVGFTGTPVFTSGAALSGTFSGNPTFSGDPIFSGDPDIASGANLNVLSGGEIRVESGGNFSLLSGSNGILSGTIIGTPTCNATVTSSSGGLAGTWSGGPTWTGNHLHQGTVTHQGDIVLSTTGKIRERVVSGADADDTYDADTADVIRVGTLSGNHVYTIGTSPSGAKLTITKTWQAAAHTITLAGTIGTLGGSLPAIRNQISGDMASITLRSMGTGWDVEQATFVP